MLPFSQLFVEIEEVLQSFSEPGMDQTETFDDCAVDSAGPCTHWTDPVDTRQLLLAQSPAMSTSNQTVMAYGYHSSPGTAFFQNSTAHPGNSIDFHLADPGETFCVNQPVVPADQTKYPAVSQLTGFNNIPKTLPTAFQQTAVPGTQETVYKEDLMTTLTAHRSPGIRSTAMYGRQRVALGGDQVALYGGQLATLGGNHVMPFSADQNPYKDQLVTSVSNQIFSAEQEMPVSGDQTANYRQVTTRHGEQILDRSHFTAPSCSQTLLTSPVTASLSEQTLCGDQQRPPIADMTFSSGQMIAPDGYQALSEQQMTDPGDQINHYSQMASSSSHNVYRGQMTIEGGEHSLYGYQTSVLSGDQNPSVDHQMTTPIGGQPLYDYQMPSSGLDTLQGNKTTNSSAEGNQCWLQQTTASCEETSYGAQVKTSVNQNVYQGQKRSLNVKESPNPQMASFSNQTPYGGIYPSPPSSSLSPSQSSESFEVSSLVQGQLPQTKSDLKTQSHVSQENSNSVRRHMCPHEGCGKSYTRAHHLKDHMLRHTGKKSYVCDGNECHWSFYRAVDLRRHKATRHSAERPYPCTKCNKNFSRLNYLKQHERAHTLASPNTGT